jgi:hypothetical protein
MIFLVIVYFNSHYGFVQQVITMFNFDPHFFFKIEFFFLKSHTLNKYSCYHVYWSSFISRHVFIFNFHTPFIVLGLALSSDNSFEILTLCSLILVAPMLACLELHTIVLEVSWILLKASCQILPNPLSTNCSTSLKILLWNRFHVYTLSNCSLLYPRKYLQYVWTMQN